MTSHHPYLNAAAASQRTEQEVRTERASKLSMLDVIRAGALEAARNNPAPSCRWSMQHLTSSKGNFCSLCGCEMPKPRFYPSAADLAKASRHT